MDGWIDRWMDGMMTESMDELQSCLGSAFSIDSISKLVECKTSQLTDSIQETHSPIEYVIRCRSGTREIHTYAAVAQRDCPSPNVVTHVVGVDGVPAPGSSRKRLRWWRMAANGLMIVLCASLPLMGPSGSATGRAS